MAPAEEYGSKRHWFYTRISGIGGSGDVDDAPEETEPLVGSVASGETLSIPEGSTEYVTATFAHDGSIDHDGTLEFLE
jgi:hypothetical protein